MQTVVLMVKAFARPAFAVSALLGATLIVVACSSKEDSEFPGDPPKPDAQVDAPGPLLPAEGGPNEAGAEAGPSSCPPKVPDGFTPTWKASTRTESACSTEDVAAYFKACLANPATTEADGTCAAFKAAKAACAQCAEPDDKSGPVQWHANRKFFTSNIAGCIAVTQDKPAAEDCGGTYNAAVTCTRAACEFCFDIGGSFEQFGACQRSAGMQGLCKSYETAQGTACVGYNAAGSPSLKCLKTSSAESNEAYFTRVVGVICGPP